jgi:hypothetical protein
MRKRNKTERALQAAKGLQLKPVTLPTIEWLERLTEETDETKAQATNPNVQ